MRKVTRMRARAVSDVVGGSSVLLACCVLVRPHLSSLGLLHGRRHLESLRLDRINLACSISIPRFLLGP